MGNQEGWDPFNNWRWGLYILCLIVLLSYLITLFLSAQIYFDCSEQYLIISRVTVMLAAIHASLRGCA
jgi:Ni/Fe-hydrogenase subunit HybB-like protein